ncbi:protein MpHAT14 [Marchantia polymorpha subsp. ruderalis]|uniref:BAH domain-containing protein n=2 Tax=Marchantia polymorpha TaxID=3197 RepID=A0AAF6BRM7_MARPO|nr:hypothetical protein MARPO_0059s0010 [Marchantia polymorpha]BBN14661.1 hypothetical protein Mp_6g13400 [Marchantia polymorpha subsp. ruderalis]|eukprot:PTQ37058.1 hypothetical protein MARPO_0059s0010 [Marchantia polymorpha]
MKASNARKKRDDKSRGSFKYVDYVEHVGTHLILFPGDCVLLRSEGPVAPVSVAKIKYLRSDLQMEILWFYRPEETTEGRKAFHGKQELLLSNHSDIQSLEAVEDVCKVYTLCQYMALGKCEKDINDFFSRFEYDVGAGRVSPVSHSLPLHCVCNSPYNPDLEMNFCQDCGLWIHVCCEDEHQDGINQCRTYRQKSNNR